MKNLLLITLLLGLVWSCGTPSKEEQNSETKPNTTAMFTIDGMTCEVGCAGVIEEELSKMNGIELAEIDFETKIATISYNNSTINDKEMVKMIEGLNDKQYAITNVEIETKKEKSTLESTSSGNSGSILSTPSFELPNILDFFTNII